MNINLIDPKLIALAVAVVLVTVVAVALYMRKRKNTGAEPRNRFGPEYDRAVKQHGSERKAEAKPTDRETRVEKLSIPADRGQSVQAHVVDYPKGAVTEANESVVSLMQARGRGGHLRYYARATRWTQAGRGTTAGLTVEDKLTASLMTRHCGRVC
jgi:hypothetical protein